jgi:WD40 repeat protein
MAILVTCDCGQQLSVKNEHAGRSVRCPICQNLVNTGATRPGRPQPPVREKRSLDDSFERRPRPRPQTASSGSALLWVLLAGGAALALLCCGVGGVVGFVIWKGNEKQSVVKGAINPPPVIDDGGKEGPGKGKVGDDGKDKIGGNVGGADPAQVAYVGPPLCKIGHAKIVDGAAVSPDGKWVVTQGEEGLLIWDAATGQRKASHFGDNFEINCKPSFTPDGTAVIVGGTAGAVGRLDVPGGGFRWLMDQPTGNVLFVAHTKTGTLMACYKGQDQLKLFEVLNRKQVATFATPAKELWKTGSMSPDGKIVIAISDKKLCLWETAPKARNLTLAQYQLQDELFDNAVCSPVAPLAMVTGGLNNRRDTVLWDLAEGNQKLALQKDVNENVDQGLAFSSDGRWVVAGMMPTVAGGLAETPVTIWSTRTGKKVAVLTGGAPEGYSDVAISRDGKRVVACGLLRPQAQGTTVYVWDITSAKLPK